MYMSLTSDWIQWPSKQYNKSQEFTLLIILFLDMSVYIFHNYYTKIAINQIFSTKSIFLKKKHNPLNRYAYFKGKKKCQR